MDVLLARTLQHQCSWTGVGRYGRKICFKDFEHIVNLFTALARDAEPKYSLGEITSTIQRILGSSTTRMLTEMYHKSRMNAQFGSEQKPLINPFLHQQ